ncbi:PAX-interacting protein [Pimephales promelas]|nr:PAX-interacting protein [Pimephales promelas]
MSHELEQDAEMVNETAVPQSNSRGRKRAATTSTSTEEAPSPTPKTPRRSVSSQAYKVLFTGLTDDDGEKVVSQLGGSLARGVNDMTQLVTDKARRTVKFLCAVARGVPIVNPDWLKKCGKVGHFLSTDEYILKDVEQEKKFSFSLKKTLQTAQSQPLLKGYEIHVTPSVMPEPSQMKEIITCCGARFLPKMPSAQKKNTVVVSCEQDRALCQKASEVEKKQKGKNNGIFPLFSLYYSRSILKSQYAESEIARLKRAVLLSILCNSKRPRSVPGSVFWGRLPHPLACR